MKGVRAVDRQTTNLELFEHLLRRSFVVRKLFVVMAVLTILAVPTFAEDRFFNSNGVKIRYTEQGAGEPIILIHGMGGSIETWIDSGVLPNLARDYRVIAFDVRGHGKSGKPHEVAAYGPQMGLDAIRLLDHLSIKRAHLVGYSMGAHIAAALLTTHAERFISTVLGGAAGRFGWTEEDLKRAEQEASERERDCVSRSQIYRLAPINGPRPSEEEIRKRSAECMANPNQDRYAIAAIQRSAKNSLITPAAVAAVKVPTLGIVGSLDGYLTDFEALKKLRPSIQLVVVENATHGSTQRHPEFIATIRQFIAKHSMSR
jgi:pimeloyl-ACP methyl ester carboxylesterase